MEYVLKQFKQSVSDNAPTEKDKILAKVIISNLYLANNRISALETMFDCAYKWKDVAIWRDLTCRCGPPLRVAGPRSYFFGQCCHSRGPKSQIR
jgi:hypothetical protein